MMVRFSVKVRSMSNLKSSELDIGGHETCYGKSPMIAKLIEMNVSHLSVQC